ELLTLTFADGITSKDTMHAAISSLVPSGSTNIYDGLSMAFDVASQSAVDDRYARIVFLSDGVPTSGITDESAIINISREATSDRVQLTSIGVGYDVNYELMKELAMAGGNFYFLEDGPALTEIFVQELDFFAFPIAKDIHITLNAGNSFYAGDAVGFDQWIPSEGGGSAFIPAVYAASRVSSSTEDPTTRRGGGSALFVRLVSQNADRDLGGMMLTMEYTDPDENIPVYQEVSVDSLAGGDGIVPVDSYYSEEVMKKSFLMLNLFLALQEVCQRAVNYNYEGARTLLIATIDHAMAVNALLEDEDITNDIDLMNRLLNNLGYVYDDDYYCDSEDCYYDDHYYQDETVNYGCSTSGPVTGSFPLVLAFLLGLALIRKMRKQQK
ncbi:VWA domain-containing protein, partial [Myxococcota bacterium]|nr:VWA domain-containing protein [Myxococcota bacterium]